MTAMTIERPPANAGPGQDEVPRLRLRPAGPGPALLDGGWWPRSADPAAELPGLVTALDGRHGRVTRLLLGTAGWGTGRPRRLTVGGPPGRRVIRLGWFASMPAGLVTAIFERGERADLVTIPPEAGEQAAAAAMRQAAREGNRDHAPAIVAAAAAASRAASGQPPTGSQLSVWDWEGGRPAGHVRPRGAVAAGAQLRLA